MKQLALMPEYMKNLNVLVGNVKILVAQVGQYHWIRKHLRAIKK
ncbi:hypothetical protein HMPREF9413_0494 [Paenibacillus sp. HGF7]|nr:hypothetical protein HMPREF9413_0494 [Paenibacillus sp. HGF7]